jgi:hypothetical protein
VVMRGQFKQCRGIRRSFMAYGTLPLVAASRRSLSHKAQSCLVVPSRANSRALAIKVAGNGEQITDVANVAFLFALAECNVNELVGDVVGA